jgi:hypothetical protein
MVGTMVDSNRDGSDKISYVNAVNVNGGSARSFRAREKERHLKDTTLGEKTSKTANNNNNNSHQNISHSFIVCVSASSEGIHAAEAARAGMDSFLQKPFKLDDLLNEYTKMLHMRDTNSGQYAAQFNVMSPPNLQLHDTNDNVDDRVGNYIDDDDNHDTAL